MYTKIKIFIASTVTLLGVFISFNTALAQVPFPSVTTFSASNVGTNYATLNGYANSNNGTTINAWFEWGTSSYYFNNRTNQINYGTYSTNYNYYLNGLSQNTTYYYRAAAQNIYGQIVYGNQMIFTTTNAYNCNYYNCYNINQPSVTTYSATQINATSVVLNGYINSYGSYATRWFEWGVNTDYFYNTTNKITQNSYPGNFSESLYNLSPNTTYYYRAVAQNSNGGGIVYGNIAVFSTTAPVVYNTNQNTTTTTTKDTTIVTAKPSPVLLPVVLNINRNGETINKGDTIEYIINYKNNSAKNLKDVVLQISIPKELEFIEASRGTFSADSNIVIANIDSLKSKEESNVRIRVKVATDTVINKLVVIKADLVYTTVGNSTQEEIFAYTKNTIEDGGVTVQQGALALLAGGNFLPNTLLGWLLIGLLMLLIFLAVRKAYFEPKLIPVPEKKGH